MVGLGDCEGLFQPQWFCDQGSSVLLSYREGVTSATSGAPALSLLVCVAAPTARLLRGYS